MPKGAWESKSAAKEKQLALENCVNTVSLLEKSIKEHANNQAGRLKDLEKNAKALKSQMISASKDLKEQGSGRRIGLAKERKGLYHLESS
ncbi:Structural maintenance of chromosomes protein 2-1 [Vitis vinifera]|uniref:Structural maintenance of chromosomes protein 2-1 n=1 Tax=Vitis vinifera TaxID=29760 RepID=A0A438CII6_VITVI|nr:Structural maintenance of chromosomes protein 2-1 [Vitis vinifera]